MTLFDPFATAASLSNCICPLLKAETRGDDAWSGTCCVWPGSSAALIDCCESGGQLSVVVLSGHPTTEFPNPETKPTACGYHQFATTFEVKVSRCVPVKIDCDCECRERAAARILGDLDAVLRGINCCFVRAADSDCQQFVINGWSLLPPEGGCSGVVATVTVETDAPCCNKD